ncbi:Exosome complex exonuclease RRP42 [Halotydeus destructor]|nr:Exosome complex exonuclease RRP42 [Halotydeus destructor]
MANIQLSDGEKLFILHGVQEGCRSDGRQCFEYRQLEIETNVLTNCHGSSHVRVGSTDILVGVKAELREPLPEEPGCGVVEFAADFSANASPTFEGRGGEEMVTELVSILNSSIGSAIDRKSLCVIHGKQVWTLYIDILVLEFSSKPSLYDCSGFGVKAALFDTRIPRVTLNTESQEMELSDDISEVIEVNIDRVPLILTLTRIGGHYIIDASAEEEVASVSSVAVAMDSNGDLVHAKKIGLGTLYSEPFKDVLADAQRLLFQLNTDLLARLNDEQLTRQTKLQRSTVT